MVLVGGPEGEEQNRLLREWLQLMFSEQPGLKAFMTNARARDEYYIPQDQISERSDQLYRKLLDIDPQSEPQQEMQS